MDREPERDAAARPRGGGRDERGPGDGASPAAESGAGGAVDGGGPDGRRARREAERGERRSAGVSRRALLTGAVLLGGAGAFGYSRREELDRWWWRYSGAAAPRVEGEVDHGGAEWIPASGANLRRASRPRDFGIDRVVVHMPEATYDVTLRVFQDPSHRASTHYVVRSEDGHVAQMVRELDVAYHAGNRAFNERSVGIEHEGWADQPEYLTEAMYRSSATLVAGICARHGIPVDRDHIVGHREVPEVVRVCPGSAWDWDRYIELVRSERDALG
ncbi:N-acetylmuramoyl-L-alanine amidase [Streptomyces bohaiensis]|uniref:N-acetylmuramoyl-L-alanine amidase n=1 Tax=Streptomyces bohaiensis TaxID=1431344 RepID=A0ABX1C530_9ACTN|nr:N-acetylmuramoyl-L-alanine amidase [Streptomyces bohaiensis]NJQ14003.1 N-acetylmuramoyl-L-alanine amidase [Streptomyces bohaiensis]